MTTRTIRIGIIGSGGIARAHVQAYQLIGHVDIVAVADIVPGKAEQFIQDQGLSAAAFQDHRLLLELDLDGVSICTPNFAHHQTTVDALLAGKHVIVEKPMSITLEQSVDMVQAAKQSGKILTVGFQPRYDPNMAAVKDIIRSGKLGKVYYVETGGGRRRGMPGGTFIRKDLAGAGATVDIGCYSLDLAMQMLDHPKPLTVSAYTSNHFGTNRKYHPEADQFEVEDFGVAMVRLEGGIVLNFKTAWAMHMDTLGSTLFLGTDAGLKLETSGIGPFSAGVWDKRIGKITIYHDVLGHHTESPIPVMDAPVQLFQAKIHDFVDAVQHHKPAPIPGEQILYNQAIIDGILRSAALNREVAIEIPNL